MILCGKRMPRHLGTTHLVLHNSPPAASCLMCSLHDRSTINSCPPPALRISGPGPQSRHLSYTMTITEQQPVYSLPPVLRVPGPRPQSPGRARRECVLPRRRAPPPRPRVAGGALRDQPRGTGPRLRGIPGLPGEVLRVRHGERVNDCYNTLGTHRRVTFVVFIHTFPRTH